MARAAAHPEEDDGSIFLSRRGAGHAKVIGKSQPEDGKSAHAQEIPSGYAVAIGMFSQIKVKHGFSSGTIQIIDINDLGDKLAGPFRQAALRSAP